MWVRDRPRTGDNRLCNCSIIRRRKTDEWGENEANPDKFPPKFPLIADPSFSKRYLAHLGGFDIDLRVNLSRT